MRHRGKHAAGDAFPGSPSHCNMWRVLSNAAEVLHVVMSVAAMLDGFVGYRGLSS